VKGRSTAFWGGGGTGLVSASMIDRANRKIS